MVLRFLINPLKEEAVIEFGSSAKETHLLREILLQFAGKL